ncbi:MAG: DUF3179 domain-containing (seleno)protein [Acidobacteriota bacterium]
MTPLVWFAYSWAKFLQEKDVVFGLDYRGIVRAYPQKILVWHEFANDEVKGEKISVTYCPLTGSAAGRCL